VITMHGPVEEGCSRIERNTTLMLLLSACLVPVVAGALPGQPQKKSPVEGNAAAILEGESLFRANCSPCHGLNARGGGRGPDLTAGRWVHGIGDEAIFQTISQGVPGTEMPANAFEDGETWALVTYLRSLNRGVRTTVSGDRIAGERLFFGNQKCVTCHMVKGRGGHLGPDLSRVGAARPIAYLTESIREPNKELSLGYSDPNNHYGMPLEYDTVIIVMKDGKRLRGVAKNEDAFSIQLLAEDDELHLYLKNELAEVRHERRSLMPAYTPEMLSAGELQDLWAYLSGLQGE
jgi:cytochrome c oxidase cbb3-type subunit III